MTSGKEIKNLENIRAITLLAINDMFISPTSQRNLSDLKSSRDILEKVSDKLLLLKKNVDTKTSKSMSFAKQKLSEGIEWKKDLENFTFLPKNDVLDKLLPENIDPVKYELDTPHIFPIEEHHQTEDNPLLNYNHLESQALYTDIPIDSHVFEEIIISENIENSEYFEYSWLLV